MDNLSQETVLEATCIPCIYLYLLPLGYPQFKVREVFFPAQFRVCVIYEMFRHRQYLKVVFLINSWWKMVRHLCWSLMGAVDIDVLESADDPSVMLVNFLYGAFLVMGVILLINMMIALLSNTYQKVQVG